MNVNEIKEVCCPDDKAKVFEEAKSHYASLGPVGAIITSAFSTLCCVGPLVLVMFGIGGAWIGNLRSFEPYRPIFILLSIGFLTGGFYRVYMKTVEVCEPGSLCAIPQTKKIGKVILWVSTIIVVFLLILPYLIGFLI
jgi:mercuric ion transport protein